MSINIHLNNIGPGKLAAMGVVGGIAILILFNLECVKPAINYKTIRQAKIFGETP
jgi:hypothetical protein